MSIEVRIVRLPHGADLPLPTYQSALAAGLDLLGAVPADAPLEMAPGERALVPTGVAMEFPSTHGALVEDRSGLAVKGITTLAGVIDPGYRGEIRVVVTNLSASALEVKPGDRIAQLRIVRRIEAEVVEVEELGEAARGAGGFGSTGV